MNIDERKYRIYQAESEFKIGVIRMILIYGIRSFNRFFFCADERNIKFTKGHSLGVFRINEKQLCILKGSIYVSFIIVFVLLVIPMLQLFANFRCTISFYRITMHSNSRANVTQTFNLIKIF